MRKRTRIIIAIVIFILFIIVFLQRNNLLQKYNKRVKSGSTDIISVCIIDEENNMQQLYKNPKLEQYVEVDIIIDGIYYNDVGIRTKGSTIYNYLKHNKGNYSYKVKLDYNDVEQKYRGMTEIHLNAENFDQTGFREYLVYKIYNEMGVKTQAYSLTHLKINEEEYGLFTMAEVINENYLKEKYNSDTLGNLYKPELSNENYLVPGGSDLRYNGDDIKFYQGILKNTQTDYTDEEDNKRLISIIKKINESSSPEVIEQYFMDFDKVIKMVAINKVVANLDGFTSKARRNFFIYEENGKIDILTFDFDLSLGININRNYWVEDIYNYDLETSNEELFSRITEIIVCNEEYLEKYNQYVKETIETIDNMRNRRTYERIRF